ncbi:MAG: methyltransferase [Candidatus Parvarchaeota archaeon]|jgi:tRNA (guanine37-N1)-methyltransferase|nr:methyltransferase [Candidatus Parvarchaeota archaeon]MCL5420191.1 methyltransferase [Candidatus Parvarchaeota archaeon]
MEKGRLNKGFDIIGGIAIVKFDGKLAKKEKINAVKKLLQNNKNVKVIFEKTGMIHGEERVPELKPLVGKDSLTIYKENGFSFYVDVKKVFFSPRMANERLRVVKEVKAKENVLDMFCGVGPFAVPIAKKAAKVTAVDINKHAISLLEKNIALNKISNIEYYRGDSKKIVKKLDEKFDRIIMNFPLYAYKFLGTALEKCNQKAVIHLYSFVKDKDSKDLKKKIMEDCKNHFKKVTIREHPAGEVAPYLERRCFDIKLSGIIKN